VHGLERRAADQDRQEQREGVPGDAKGSFRAPYCTLSSIDSQPIGRPDEIAFVRNTGERLCLVYSFNSLDDADKLLSFL
jgi:hypothetical protein